MAESVAHLSPHSERPVDERILERVWRALWGYEPLRASGSIIEVIPHGDGVKLAGRVRTQILKEMATYVAAAVEDVHGVENTLISDAEVIRAAADALAADDVTRPYVIRVEARLGLAKLVGIVPSTDVEQRALELARAVPIALDAVSELEIDPSATFDESNAPPGSAPSAAAETTEKQSS